MSSNIKKTIQGTYIFSSTAGYDIEVHHGTYASFDALNAFVNNKDFSLFYKASYLYFKFNNQTIKLDDKDIVVKKLKPSAVNKLAKNFSQTAINKMGGLEALHEQMHLIYFNDTVKGKDFLEDSEREAVNIKISNFESIDALSDNFDYLAHGFIYI